MTNPAQDLRSALEWYGEQARLARLIHSEGDVDLGRKERTRCSHYVQVLDEIYAALHQEGSGEWAG